MLANYFRSVIVAAVLLSLSLVEARPGGHKQRSVIQLISDGHGPASMTFARSLKQAKDGKPWDVELQLDQYHVGSIRTRSTDSLVTDSAASATAYSCGVKSVNAYIGVDNLKKPCGTVLEAAKQKHYNTALVTTSRVTHATPASYAAHIDDRDLENEIAAQELGETVLGRQVDLIWGGGLRHFLPNTSSGSSRDDERDLTKEATDAGWSFISSRKEFDALKNGKAVKLPSLGLFTKSHMAYEVDRVAEKEPSLKEMAIAALNALKKEGKPFFIMIEGARIDHAAHNNDPIGHFYDIVQYNDMFQAVTEWVDKNEDGKANDPHYVVLSTSDHECGGLTLAEQRIEDEEAEYLWYPDVLYNAKHSTEFLAAQYLAWAKNNTVEADQISYMRDTIIKDNLAVPNVQDDEVQRAFDLSKEDDSGLSLTIFLASILNWRAQLGWSTTGHSGVDVPLYAYVKHHKKNRHFLDQFAGNHENTFIGQWTAKWLNLDLAAVTQTLNNGSTVPAGSGSQNKTTSIGSYHSGKKRVLPARPASSAQRRSVGYSHLENTRLMGQMAKRAAGSHERSHAIAARKTILERRGGVDEL